MSDPHEGGSSEKVEAKSQTSLNSFIVLTSHFIFLTSFKDKFNLRLPPQST